MPREGRIVVQNRYAPYLRALGAGVGVAVNNYRPVRDIAQALRRSYDDYRSRKPRREPPAKRQAVSMPINAGATNVLQRAVIKRRTGRRVKKRSVKYLYKLTKATLATQIQRYQGFTEYDKNGYYPIGYSAAADFSAKYPVYIFDLTSCRSSTNQNVLGVPFYRLVSTAGGEFGWEIQFGQTAGGTATSNTWDVERATAGQNANFVAIGMGARSMLDWSDIRLALYGATQQTTRFNVSFIQFVDEAYHPRQIMQAPPVPVVYPGSDSDQQGRFNAAWQEVVKPLVYHPLHTAGNATNIYRVLDSKSYVVQPDTQTNEAIASPNVCLKTFKRMNRLCRWDWQTSNKADSTTAGTGNRINVADGDGMDKIPEYNQWIGIQAQPYVHPNARVYMMITAQAYTRTTGAGGELPINAANTPTFDLMVRNKWTFDRS